MSAVTVQAHPNIALVKYWGKQDKPGNIPATPNLSITLSQLTTTTKIEVADQDEMVFDNKSTHDDKVLNFLSLLRNRFDIPPLHITTQNNFPTGAGLASSASGFAALIYGINHLVELNLNEEMMSEWARMGSASAARSLFGGYVALVPPLWRAQMIAPKSYWPLQVVIAITSNEKKAVSSTQGMNLSRDTSPFYKTWTDTSADNFAAASQAINQKNFQALAEVAELSCLKMHSVMLTTQPTLAYWNTSTLACLKEIQQMREGGLEVFFTIDAGPQIKAVCTPSSVAQVQNNLAAIPGVIDTQVCQLGDGPTIID